jgi:rare lipoprotein A
MSARLGRLSLITAAAIGAAALSACASITPDPRYPVAAGNAPAPFVPPTQGRRQVGKPYEIGGKWYTPHEDPDYDEVGLASWYGAAHNGRPTANGETFDMSLVTAAHKTLPLPSIVEVTNLDTGKKVRVRVNDRGPFVDGRIIDLSKAAAEELGTMRQGVARVRVRYIGPAPLEMARNERRGRTPEPVAEAPRSAPPPRPPSRETYEVQVGAFSQRANAEKAADMVGGELRPLDRNGVTLWRVVVGGLSDLDRAEQVRDRAAQSGFEDAKIAGPF